MNKLYYTFEGDQTVCGSNKKMNEERSEGVS